MTNEKIVLFQEKVVIKKENCEDVEPYSELRMELLKKKENSTPMVNAEVPVVNPNAALGTPPRLRPEPGNDHDGHPDDERKSRHTCS